MPLLKLAWEALIFGAPLKRTATYLKENWPLYCSIIFSSTLKGISQWNTLYDSYFSHCSWITELHLQCYSRSSKDWTQYVFPNIIYYCISIILCSKSTEACALFYLHPTLSHFYSFSFAKVVSIPAYEPWSTKTSGKQGILLL